MVDVLISVVATLGVLYLISPTIRTDITGVINKAKEKVSKKKSDS